MTIILTHVDASDLAMKDMLCAEDVQGAIDTLREAGADTVDNHPERAQYEALVIFYDECERACDDWAYGAYVIHEQYFEAYIAQLIEDCYDDVPSGRKSNQWPYRHMKLDIAAAAQEAQADYTPVQFGIHTFFAQ